ncbi:general secretion pathway protein J [Pseudoalteromonas ulvae UL12]|uniref:Type II secretion system protein J n=1 Tax=Pseudoalteromonas ulvae TaxID=107327 RepID=A0A244CP49_PSEDV|nr:type II secretion system minor pseudopilin GspJ [Pseudoalteromonas ulvae]MBE0364294.1 general secretion pathway protein J [Pseudoalteromonas ulvae UL12]OUL57390.1 type II secretion system protein GspJ [Pseudoalteromonas ulvae]
MKQRGFTLLEVMVALGILGFIVVATHQIFQTSLRTNELSEQTIAELEGLQTTFRLMEQDFSQISRRIGRNEAGDSAEQYLIAGRNLLDSQFDGVGFVREGWRNPAYLLPRSELQAVGYRVFDDNLERIYKVYVDSLDNSEPRKHVLLNNIEEFKVTYRDNKGKWLEKWQNKELPLAVAIEITIKDMQPIKRLFLVPGSGEK